MRGATHVPVFNHLKCECPTHKAAPSPLHDLCPRCFSHVMDQSQGLPSMSSDAVAISAAIAEKASATTEVYRVSNQAGTTGVAEVEQMKCECCGLVEECTPTYVSTVRRVHCGRWVCGLCAEAVKEELCRGLSTENVGMEDALRAHMGICMQFNKMEKKANPIIDIASAMRRLLRRSMDGSVSPHSAPSSPRRGATTGRANSCLTPFSRSRGYEAPL